MIEEFLAVGEKLFGPYVWGRYGQRAWFPRARAGASELVVTEPPAPPGRYDILFMPPSFPFGGMENPCLTFLTPCVLAGDRSLADVVIHEISHSWFGNLVTNATWGEFWLNEGFTMYAQRRISTQVYGAWRGRACGSAVPPGAAGAGACAASPKRRRAAAATPRGFHVGSRTAFALRWPVPPQPCAGDMGAVSCPASLSCSRSSLGR